MARILGLDLGTASIGWAYVEILDEEEGEIIGAGVRSFEEPVEAKSREPKNAKRRIVRGMRKNLMRRAMRRAVLREALVKGGLAPLTPAEVVEWLGTTDPYELRLKGLDQELTLHEFGRVLLHLTQKRGFLSNRKAKGLAKTGDPEVDQLIEQDELEDLKNPKEKADKSAKGEDVGPVLSAIADLKKQLEEEGSRTLGEFLARRALAGQRVRGRHTLRAMFEREFEVLWEVQASFKPDRLTDALRTAIHRALFHQRPLKNQTSLRKNCALEPNRKAIPVSHYLSHRIRIWQTLANLELIETDGWSRRRLTLPERQKVYQLLLVNPKLTWTNLRKLLGLPDRKKMLINYEQGKSLAALVGSITEITLGSLTDGQWTSWTEEQKELLMDILFHSETDKVKLKRLRQEMGLDPRPAYYVARQEWPKGIGAYSAKAVKKLLPHLEAGMDLTQARAAAGYQAEWEIDRGEGNDKLMFLEIPDARNPTVNKIVHEARKVVNAIIRRYGKPDRIHVELGRDVAMSDDQKKGINQGIKRDEARNKEAEEKFRELYPSSEPSRLDKRKYRLWKECRHVCPYTGRTIPITELWTKAWEIEHMIPYSISLDDSMANLTLCASEANLAKGNRLPIEYLGEGTEAWRQALARVQDWDCGGYKKKRFAWTRESLPSDFASRQLNDTRYASRLIRDYVKTLGVEAASSSGRHTAVLRRHWGLHTVLSEDGEKVRSDHRHHAVDALVVALMTPALVKRISDLAARGGGLETGEIKAPLPWPTLRRDAVEAVGQIIVSHEPTRRIRGALHEETGYGKRAGVGFTTRKPLSAMTEGEFKRIVDPRLRQEVAQYILRNGNDLKVFQDGKGLPLVDRHGVVHTVFSARIAAQKQEEDRFVLTGSGYHPTGGNQWCLVLEDLEARRLTAVVVSLYHAAQAKFRGQGPEAFVPQGHRLLYTLCKNDMVEVAGEQESIYRVKKFNTMSPVDLWLVPHWSAGEEGVVRIVSAGRLEKIVRVIETPLP